MKTALFRIVPMTAQHHPACTLVSSLSACYTYDGTGVAYDRILTFSTRDKDGR